VSPTDACPPPPRRLWLVRHAAPQVAPGTCYGTLDVAADPAATRHAAERLAAALPAGARVFHSPLQRCEQLALGLQVLRPDLPSNPDPRLREMDFGRWEGQPWDHIGRDAIDAWTAAFASHRPGDGENLAAVLARVAAALQDHRRAGRQATPASDDVVWITHAGVIRSVAWLQAHGMEGALPRPEEWPLAAPGWGEWTITALGPALPGPTGPIGLADPAAGP
jgi:alpha-ribazole phosphatase